MRNGALAAFTCDATFVYAADSSEVAPTWPKLGSVGYFQGYDEAVDARTLTDPRPRIEAHVLPFNQLGPRVFELLCAQLTRATSPPDHVVYLMGGANDGGRDVVSYCAGTVKRIAQCKNYGERMTLPQVVEELCKLALHDMLEPDVLPPSTPYEVWCPGGFSGTAADLLNLWPKRWKQSDFMPASKRLLTRPTFAKLRWQDALPHLRDKFPDKLVPFMIDGGDASRRVREQVAVYDEFFDTRRVASTDELEALLDRKGLRHLEHDRTYIDDRVRSFPEATRVFVLRGFVMGLEPAFIAQMTASEFRELIETASGTVPRMWTLVMKIASRMANERVSAFQLGGPSHALFAFALVLLLSLQAYYATMRGMMGETVLRDVKPELKAAVAQSIEEQLTGFVADDLWEKFGSRLATQFGDVDAVREYLRRCYGERASAVDTLVRSFAEELPTDLLVIDDSRPLLDPRQFEMLKKADEAIRPPGGEFRPK